MVVGGHVVYDDLEWPASVATLLRTLRSDGVALLAHPGWVAEGKLRVVFQGNGFAVTRNRRIVAWPPTTRQRRKAIDRTSTSTRSAGARLRRIVFSGCGRPRESPHAQDADL
jgi:hypothetical protein